MPTMHARTRLAMVAATLLTVSACAKPIPVVLSPPAIDVEGAAEPKPLPPPEIATDEDAALQYDLALEAWGERVSAAGRRVCRWLVKNGAEYACPETNP